MLKKLAFLMMSLLICLSLLPGQASAAGLPEPVDDLPAVVEEARDETESEGIMLLGGEVPEEAEDVSPDRA